MSVNFHIDRYSSGKFSSYDKYRARHNNKIDILTDPKKKEAQSNQRNSEDSIAAQKIGSNELSSEGQRLLDYSRELNIPYVYPYP